MATGYNQAGLNAVLQHAPQSGDPIAFITSAIIESGLNPQAVGDGGHSHGLFQLNDQGRLASYGLTPQQAYNPGTNARVSADEFSKINRQKGLTGVELALASQRPSDPNYRRKYLKAEAQARDIWKQHSGNAVGGATTEITDEGPTVGGQGVGFGLELSPEAIQAALNFAQRSSEDIISGRGLGDVDAVIAKFLQGVNFTKIGKVPGGSESINRVGETSASENAPTPTAGGGWGGSEGAVKSITGNLPPGFQVTSEKRDRKHTASGGVSDHWTGSKTSYARDIFVPGGKPTKAADQLASRIVASLGGPAGWGAKGGIFNKTVNGIRWQVLWKSSDRGHDNHIHVGARVA